MKCSGTNTELVPPAAAQASFELLDSNGNQVDAAATPSSPAAIDLHQLGAGVGGHLFFSHTGPPGTAEVEGEWQAHLSADPTYGTAYDVKAFIPDIAAATDHATYEIVDSSGFHARTINQGAYGNAWVSLGYYLCSNQGGNACSMTVTLRTTAPADDPNLGADIAMDAVAFVPVPTGAYVALGDSYSSGEGVGGTFNDDNPYNDGTDVSDSIDGNRQGDLCHRSPLAWPQLLATAKHKTIIDLTCSGSNTGDVAGEQYYFAEDVIPFTLLGHTFFDEVKFAGDGTLHSPQQSGDNFQLQPNPDNAGSSYFNEMTQSDIDQTDEILLLKALRPSLVTITVGGDDIGFADVVKSCFLRGVFLGGSCRDNDFTSNGKDLLDARIGSVEPVLEDTYRKIVAAVGSAANVYVVTYPAAVQAPPPNVDSCTGMFDNDLAWLVPKVGELANVIKTAGQAAGVHVIDISTLFNNHDACGEYGTPWATPPDSNPSTVPFDSVSAIDNWLHPNAAGYQAIEAAVAGQIH
jgi:lysophospholipase L1-like esterase